MAAQLDRLPGPDEKAVGPLVLAFQRRGQIADHTIGACQHRLHQLARLLFHTSVEPFGSRLVGRVSVVERLMFFFGFFLVPEYQPTQ